MPTSVVSRVANSLAFRGGGSGSTRGSGATRSADAVRVRAQARLGRLELDFHRLDQALCAAHRQRSLELVIEFCGVAHHAL